MSKCLEQSLHALSIVFFIRLTACLYCRCFVFVSFSESRDNVKSCDIFCVVHCSSDGPLEHQDWPEWPLLDDDREVSGESQCLKVQDDCVVSVLQRGPRALTWSAWWPSVDGRLSPAWQTETASRPSPASCPAGTTRPAPFSAPPTTRTRSSTGWRPATSTRRAASSWKVTNWLPSSQGQVDIKRSFAIYGICCEAVLSTSQILRLRSPGLVIQYKTLDSNRAFPCQIPKRHWPATWRINLQSHSWLKSKYRVLGTSWGGLLS